MFQSQISTSQHFHLKYINEKKRSSQIKLTWNVMYKNWDVKEDPF